MHQFFLTLSRIMATLGGIMLLTLVIMTCLSIVGRTVNGILHSDPVQSVIPGVSNWLIDVGVGPVNGDFELVEAGIAFAIFAFLPLCQITGGHASVDVFTSKMPPRVTQVLRWITDVIFAIVLVLIAVQLFAGLQSKFRSGQTTFLLEFPLWWAYALSFSGAFVAALVSVYIAIARSIEALTGRALLPDDLGAEH